MNHSNESAADRDFFHRFSRQRWETGLDHLAHVRLVWLYLNRYDTGAAAQLLCAGLKTYAESKGAYDKFHLTLTDALVRIMAARKGAKKNISWQHFLHINADIVQDYRSVLARYFSHEHLYNNAARFNIVAPDIQALPGTR